MDVPAGFRRENSQQQNFRLFNPLKISTTIDDPSLNKVNHPTQVLELISDHKLNQLSSESLQTQQQDSETSTTNPISTTHTSTSLGIPLVRSVDKVSSSLPKHISMTEEFLRTCVGFRRIDTLKQHLQSLYQPTISLDKTTPDAVLDVGYFATLRKKNRSTTPVP
jgi:hypothetical protein